MNKLMKNIENRLDLVVIEKVVDDDDDVVDDVVDNVDGGTETETPGLDIKEFQKMLESSGCVPSPQQQIDISGPRGIDIPIKDISSGDSNIKSNEEDDDTLIKKRGRGRPRKNPDGILTCKDSNNSIVKRGRGRPRKNMDDYLTVEDSKDLVKKKRGRPRKVLLMPETVGVLPSVPVIEDKDDDNDINNGIIIINASVTTTNNNNIDYCNKPTLKNEEDKSQVYKDDDESFEKDITINKASSYTVSGGGEYKSTGTGSVEKENPDKLEHHKRCDFIAIEKDVTKEPNLTLIIEDDDEEDHIKHHQKIDIPSEINNFKDFNNDNDDEHLTENTPYDDVVCNKIELSEVNERAKYPDILKNDDEEETSLNRGPQLEESKSLGITKYEEPYVNPTKSEDDRYTSCKVNDDNDIDNEKSRKVYTREEVNEIQDDKEVVINVNGLIYLYKRLDSIGDKDNGILTVKHDAVKDINQNGKTLLKTVREILDILYSVDTRGFYTEVDLSKMPIIKDLAIPLIKRGLKGDRAIKAYRWLTTYLMLSLYDLILIELDKMINIDTDEKADYNVLANELYSKLEPSLRAQIQKRGISINQNTYTGFDTEYYNINPTTNRLLSAQLAINSKTILKIPIVNWYRLSTLDASNGTRYYVSYNIDDGSDMDKYSVIENSLNTLIRSIRYRRFKVIDESINIIVQGLKKYGLPHIEKDDTIIFSFPRSPMKRYVELIEDGGSYSMLKILQKTESLMVKYLDEEHDNIINVLKRIYERLDVNEQDIRSEGGEMPYELDVVGDDYEYELNDRRSLEDGMNDVDISNLDSITKNTTRSYMSGFTGDRISVSRIRNNYVIAHNTPADLSMLSDFNDLKDDLTILNKVFITMGKPIKYKGYNLILRDTTLLAPGGSKSLAKLGELYEDSCRKIQVSNDYKSRMDLFLKDNKEGFCTYAVQDAVITLVHANWTEDFNFSLNDIGVPLTLSSLSSKYVRKIWYEEGYEGYQKSRKFLLGNVSSSLTPKGLFVLGEVGEFLALYISNYKGGRNESYMYGCDKEKIWYDYDLTSAYTTVMAGMGTPDYRRGRIVDWHDIRGMTFDELLYDYIIIKVQFSFKSTVKYPSIPVYVDEATTVYPLKGEAVITGSEYLLAKSQGCFILVKFAYHIPSERAILRDEKGKKLLKVYTADENEKRKKLNKPIEYQYGGLIGKPFENIINDVQKMRRLHPKGTVSNLMYKELGNSIYGAVVRGMGDKKRFDIKSGRTVRMEGNDLSNPILASWITGFIRSIIGECLHNIHLLKGSVVSVTTDGFITDIDNLETKILENNDKGSALFKEFKRLRGLLSNDDTGLELKNKGRGIISWTTRGQFSKDANISATTGLQTREYSKEDVENMLLDGMRSDKKKLEYIQSTLRSAKDIYTYGGHVTKSFRDQTFRLTYDNRRKLKVPENLRDNIDYSNVMIDSEPLTTSSNCLVLRSISKHHHKTLYSKVNSPLSGNKYKSYSDLAVRNFIKGLLSEPRKYNLDGIGLNDYNSIMDFVKGYDSNFKISKQSISNLKNRNNITKTVPRQVETESFVKYVKDRYEDFNEDMFFRPK